MTAAACIGADPEQWFDAEREAEAVAFCEVCPVRAQCLDYATAERIGFGVWGGLAERQRTQYPTAGLALTAPQVERARREAAAGVPAQTLAARLGVTRRTVVRALTGRTWPDASGPLLRYDHRTRRWEHQAPDDSARGHSAVSC